MATNNYYGFTHGGTQYPPQGQYPTTASSQGYASSYGATSQAAAPSSAQQSYGTAATTDPYVIGGYARAPTGQATQQSYYGQTQQGQTYVPPVGVPTTPKTTAAARPAQTSTVYPTYQANTAGSAASSYAGFAPPATSSSTTTPGSKSFTNYDAAVYNAVTAYAQGSTGSGSRGGGLGYKRGLGGKMKGGPRAPPKPQTLHYCDVCKISCAGPQTYKEHLEGQKHKKKEQAAKAGAPVTPAKGSHGGPGLRCELCDVTCTGNDAYAAHIRGAKHQKVLKLHTKLGKPIPSDSPTVVTPTTTSSTTSSALKQVPITPSTTATSGTTNNVVKPVTPKINFIGPKADFDRYGLSSTGSSTATTPAASGSTAKDSDGTVDFRTPIPGKTSVLGAISPSPPINVAQSSDAAKKDTPPVYTEKDIQPVGQDYIDEVRGDDGKLISFNCKLCECRFNDPNAKEMHMKGRRHRLQYKKKVNPDLVVDVKPSSRQKKTEDRRANRPNRRGGPATDQFARGGPPPLIAPRGFGPQGGYGPTPLFYIPPLIRRNETAEDHHVMAKHAEIYPAEEELQAIQKIVSNTEKALKFVSDQFAEADAKKVNGVAEDTTTTTAATSDSTNSTNTAAAATTSATTTSTTSAARNESELQVHRILKGVMRVGHLAKGLLLKGDRVVDLVVLCSEKPTLAMLNQVADTLPEHFQTVAPEEKYEVIKDVSNSRIIVGSTVEPKIQVTVTLTSPLLRQGETPGGTAVKEESDLLDKEKCLEALAALRHAKWFQARATSLQSCVIIIRILRDICQRIPEWKSFPCWAVELLTEKAITSVGMPVSPGDAFRIVLEAIASGILLPKGNGLLDPCEKESVDALQPMSDQDRIDFTAYGQKALRMISFRKIHEVLGMEALPRFNRKANVNTRKRRRNNSASAEADGENEADGKKDKKEDEIKMEVETTPSTVIKSETEH